MEKTTNRKVLNIFLLVSNLTKVADKLCKLDSKVEYSKPYQYNNKKLYINTINNTQQ